MRPTSAFLDRDGTIVRDTHFLGRPDDVELLPGAAAAVRRLNDTGITTVLVTNQSGIARGLLTEQDYAAVHARLVALLAAEGARLDAAYYCPHAPELSPACDCRKPAAGMFRRAAAEHGLDMSAPVFIGDRWRDVAAADELGGTRFVIHSPRTTAEDLAEARRTGTPVVASLSAAVDRALALPSGASAPVR